MQRLFTVNKTVLSEFGHWSRPLPSLTQNRVRLTISKFAFTANNMTYAHAGGPPLNYWHFYDHLTLNPSQRFTSKQGVIPVWGFAEVTQSRNPAISEGTRFYGYYPMSNTIDFDPTKPSLHGFTSPRYDPALAAVYNTYMNTATDPFYTDPAGESAMMIFRPLFLTSFMLADYIERVTSNVEQVVLTSASSKTAFGLAWVLKRKGVKVVGLTSGRNVAFVNGLDVYDEVRTYEQVEEIERSSTVVVDMAGSHSVNVDLDRHLGTQLVRNVGVGMTHNTVLDGEKSEYSSHAQEVREFFFAPAWIKKRINEDAGIMGEAADAYKEFVERAGAWVEYEETDGWENWGSVYKMMEEGTARPDKAYILKP